MISSTALPLSTLPPLLDQAKCSMQNLLSLLKEEQEYLIANQLDQLVSITQKKQSTALDAEQAGLALSLFFAEQGLSPNSDISAWFSAELPSSLIEWQALLEASRQAAAFNSSNGKLIETRQHLINAFMQQLLEASHNSPLYAPDGKLTALPQGQRRDTA
ncbi:MULTISPECIES: flagella synthesis protein FlgN [unclassified Iodobacter]|uniref:flagella synthesis protein FlgN n=1 Tax=unclassified Iodobacter TaxID=235634 RepID=UPI0025F2D5A2|nr:MULTISPECIES: flagellar protein FlgN [unclassified Iodobacter]MDW5417659.1 flagellar protein FlgN [Iodobacter sp. CM08]